MSNTCHTQRGTRAIHWCLCMYLLWTSCAHVTQSAAPCPTPVTHREAQGQFVLVTQLWLVDRPRSGTPHCSQPDEACWYNINMATQVESVLHLCCQLKTKT